MEIDDVLTYWIGTPAGEAAELELSKRRWFEGGSAIDDEIRGRFGALVAKARDGALASWADTPRGTLALIVLLDQFCRNVHRGTSAAFSHDPVCLELAQRGFDTGRFDALGPVERLFAALPFRHAEDVDSQKRAVELSVGDALRATPVTKDFLVYSVDWARKHLDVIVRFGRFPHRNEVLGRPSTDAERAYLAYLKLAGQWL